MRKQGIWLLVAAFFTAAALSFALLIDKVTVSASDNALIDQGWYVSFSSPLKLKSVGSDDLFVTDSKGKKMAADIVLSKNRKSLHITGLKPGAYTLHVKKDAVEGKRIKSLPVDKIKFTIHEKLESVSSAKDLKVYFEKVMANQKRYKNETVESEIREEMGLSSKADSAASNEGGSDYSTTNNQVEGVDEADRVKTNGDYIYSALGEGKVVITDIRNPERIVKASEIKFGQDFYSSQLFLQDNTLIVLGEKYFPSETRKISGTSIDSMPINGMTNVQFYDVSNPKRPLLIREIGTEGYLNGARKTGNMLYFVTNVRPAFEWFKEIDGNALRPRVYDSKESKDIKGLAYSNISILPGAMEPSYSVITAIDISSPTENKVVTKGYLGGSEQLYMSKENLYLTATKYEEDMLGGPISSRMIWNPGNSNTEVFKFALNKTNVKFHSSALLKGNLLNQFSMDEHKGYFRAVTTEGNMWDEKNISKNHLFILDENMKHTGSVEGLAKGERIYSARFMGDKAYMVTFRETDPLFVIDVANPAAPKVLGELKIPGFSNYLHPLDENHLIGFGYETEARKNPGGGEPLILTGGMKISLFDVSDFANPKEKDTEIIGGRGTYSPIQYDHKALFQHKERNLYGFPVIVYKETGKPDYVEYQSSGALFYEITAENGIVLKGDLLKAKEKGQMYEEWEKEVQRILYSKDTLYTVSMKELKSYSLDTFKQRSKLNID